MVSYNDFKNTHLDKGFNIDNHYGAQCWDGYAKYCIYLGVPYANCTTSGYVKDIWTNRHSNGILNHFDEVTQMQPGDVAVFKNHPSTPLSHIAVFDSDAGGGYGWFLGQNQGGVPQPQGGSSFNLAKLPYSATYDTAFRPKKFKTAPTPTPAPAPAPAAQAEIRWIPENGTMRTHHAIYARLNGPSTGNPSPYMFPAGSTIRYDAYCHANGYVWIRQKRANGGYWYIPTGSSNGSRRTSQAWGTFY